MMGLHFGTVQFFLVLLCFWVGLQESPARRSRTQNKNCIGIFLNLFMFKYEKP